MTKGLAPLDGLECTLWHRFYAANKGIFLLGRYRLLPPRGASVWSLTVVAVGASAFSSLVVRMSLVERRK